MTKTKQKLKEIKHEVKELHPLLDRLFEKLPNIIHKEYKQGPNEDGADFVLVKSDETLGGEEYIGVVVKKDTITKASHDVVRQIDECLRLTRVIRGKDTIKLDDIWVITSNNISISAQEYFTEKYSSAKIKFIDNERLTRLIDTHIPDYLNSAPSNVNNYILSTKESLLQVETNSQLSFLGISGVSVPQDLLSVEKIKYKENNSLRGRRSKKTSVEKIQKKKSVSLIEGGMGSGKSTLIRNTAISMLDQEVFEETQTLPVYVTFKDLIFQFDAKIEKLISQKIGELAESVKVTIFLDGVDESKLNLAEVADYIDSLIGQVEASENWSLIMTARSLDENAIASKISRSYKTYHIAPLSLNQIVKVLEDSCKNINIKNRIIEDLKKSSLYKALPKTPIATLLLAKLLNENENDIPSNLTELYSKFVELSLGRWDLGKNLVIEKEYSVCKIVSGQIAQYFIDHDLTKISIAEAIGFFKDYLQPRKLDLDGDKLFYRMLENSDLFYIDSEQGVFGFKHRTFIEFMYAQKLHESTNIELSEEAFEMYWSTIFFFWVGLKKDCPNELRSLANVVTTHDRTRLLKIVNLGNMLLAGYGSPYDAIEEAIKVVFVEASKLMLDTISSKTKLELTKFSEMHIVWLFRHLMSETYNYEFFSSAVENAMIDIASDHKLGFDVIASALFLLDTSQTSGEIENLFDNLSTPEMLKRAPVSIQLAVTHEAKDRKIQNQHTKRIGRNIRKILEGKAGQHQIKQLYELPVHRLSLK